MAITKAVKPAQSNDVWSASGMRLSGVPFIRTKLSAATAMDIQKIQRHPREDATSPPKSEQTPDPPHEPIDQKLNARCRSFSAKYALINASVAGMMQAAERPWMTRPAMR